MYAVTTTYYDASRPAVYEAQARKLFDFKQAASIAGQYIDKGETFVGVYQSGCEIVSANAYVNWSGEITDICIAHDVDTYDNEVAYIIAAMKHARRKFFARHIQS